MSLKQTSRSNAAARAAGPATQGLKVVARAASFRRAGRVFGAEPTIVPLSGLTDDQVEQLRGEPMLVVQDVEIPAAESAATSAEDK